MGDTTSINLHSKNVTYDKKLAWVRNNLQMKQPQRNDREASEPNGVVISSYAQIESTNFFCFSSFKRTRAVQHVTIRHVVRRPAKLTANFGARNF